MIEEKIVKIHGKILKEKKEDIGKKKSKMLIDIIT